MKKKRGCERCVELEAQLSSLATMMAVLLARLDEKVEITPYEMLRTRRAKVIISRSDDVVVGGANIILRRDPFSRQDTIEVAR